VTAIHIALGVALIVVNFAAGAWGVWCWWRHEPAARGFWPLLRIGQALVMIEAVDGAILLFVPPTRELPELHLIYGLVPLGVSFIAEQLRLAAADTVLAQRGLEGRADVEKLPEREQRALVFAIVHREMGVMAASALVVGLLGLRAAAIL
jgi:hypothetical protein